MKNKTKFAAHWLMTSAAALFLVAGGFSTAQAQTAAPTPAPAPAQPEATDHSGMGHGGMGMAEWAAWITARWAAWLAWTMTAACRV